MAVAVEILLLVVLISNNIQAEVVQGAGDSHRFILDKTADFCSISRWTGEEKELLWNSSERHDSSREDSYQIFNLDVSHSGQYQVKCWTRGNVTHERNSTLLVCGVSKMKGQTTTLAVGQKVELTCDGAGPNQSVQWVFSYENHKTKNSELISVLDGTYKRHELVKNRSLLVTFNKPTDMFFYYCLMKNHKSCDLLQEYLLVVRDEVLYRSVGESLELNCSHIRENQTHEWQLSNSAMTYGESVWHNYTLMFPSLTLDNTGLYTCNEGSERYRLFVCPESDPPAEVFFTGGENVTLQCGDWKQTDDIHWFMKTNRTEGTVVYVDKYLQPDRMYLSDVSLVITNVSLQDSGEFWCVIDKDRHCVFTSKTLVMFGEPEFDHHVVRSALLSVVIIMMTCVVVATVWRTRRGEQLPVPVEEVEMSELSPESAHLQLETPV